MPQPSTFPILSLAAEALADTARATLALIRIYWLPTAIYIIAMVAARVVWFEHVTAKSSPPVWIEVVLWTPFAAVISVAAFRYFAGENPPNWRHGFKFGRLFWLACLCLFAVNLVYRYMPAVEQDSVLAAWRYVAGPDWLAPASDGQTAIAGIRLLAQIAGFAVNALVGAVAMGVTWMIATRDVVDWGRLKKLLLMFPLSLFAYLLMFEIVYYQVGLVIDWFYSVLSIPYPAPPPQLGSWRERVVPELLREVYNIPFGFVVTLLWLTAIATAFRYLEGGGTGDRSPDHRHMSTAA